MSIESLQQIEMCTIWWPDYEKKSKTRKLTTKKFTDLKIEMKLIMSSQTSDNIILYNYLPHFLSNRPPGNISMAFSTFD